MRGATRNPPWLAPGSAGDLLFRSHDGFARSPSIRTKAIPYKLIAHNGSHVYVAAGEAIRWADLRKIQDRELNRSLLSESVGGASGEALARQTYKVLDANTAGRIVHLSLSPSGHFLAVVTTTGLYAVTVPNLGQIDDDGSIVGVSTYEIGPGVYSGLSSEIASVLWHPLGLNGSCLVVVSVNATVRLYELDVQNGGSFVRPTTTLDLNVLVEAKYAEDILPSSDLSQRTESLYEFTVASASFGSPDLAGGLWSAMTLWVAASSGTLYSLCPFLPSTWEAPASILTSIRSFVESIATGETDDDYFEGANGGILEWCCDIEDQLSVASRTGRFNSKQCRLSRPRRPAVPMLQGPFVSTHDYDGNERVCDLLIRSLTLPASELSLEAVAFDGPSPVSSHMVCVLTTGGNLYIMLDLVGSIPRWLPSRTDVSSNLMLEYALISIEYAPLLDGAEEQQDSIFYFCQDQLDDFQFLISHATGIMSVTPEYMRQVAEELVLPTQEGMEVRLRQVAINPFSNREFVAQTTAAHFSHSSSGFEASSCVVIRAIGMEPMVLSSVGSRPIGAIFGSENDDSNKNQALLLEDGVKEEEFDDLTKNRVKYVVPAVLENLWDLKASANSKITKELESSMPSEISLTTNSLNLMMALHGTIASNTHDILTAVGNTFLQAESLSQQLPRLLKSFQKANSKIREIQAEYMPSPEPDSSGRFYWAARMDRILNRQRLVRERASRLVGKISQLAGQAASSKEEAWTAEIDKTAAMFGLQRDSITPEQVAEYVSLRDRRSKRLKKEAGLPAPRKRGDGSDGLASYPDSAGKEAGNESEDDLLDDSAFENLAAFSKSHTGDRMDRLSKAVADLKEEASLWQAANPRDPAREGPAIGAHRSPLSAVPSPGLGSVGSPVQGDGRENRLGSSMEAAQKAKEDQVAHMMTQLDASVTSMTRMMEQLKSDFS